MLRISNGKGYFADLFALPDRTDVVRTLLQDGVTFFWEAGVYRADCWLPELHPYQGPLRAGGFSFRRVPAELSVLQRKPEVDLSFLRDPEAPVHVFAGDSDLV